MISGHWCLLRCWRELWNSKHMRCDLNTVQLLISSKVRCKKFSVGNHLISEGCASSCWWVSKRIVWNLDRWCLQFSLSKCDSSSNASLSFVSQVIWPGTQPSSTRSPASQHQFGPSKGLLESLGDQAHLEPLVNKDPQVPQASQETRVCQGPQENEVSWTTPVTEWAETRV